MKKSQEQPASKLEILEQTAMAWDVPHLFHLQMEEVLKEARMKRKRREKLTEVVDCLKDFLMNLPPGKEHQLQPGQRAWLKGVKLPVEEKQATKGCFQFRPPTRVYLGGSTPLNTCIQPSRAADLVLEMPKECFQAKDWLNHRYVRKRARYLSAIAVALGKRTLVKDMTFALHQGNSFRPILVLSVPAEGKGLFNIHIHAVPEEGTFKMNRFHVTKNNVRPGWFSTKEDQGADENGDGSSLPATPFYNMCILQDVCYEENAQFVAETLADIGQLRDAVALLKIWAHQRELDLGFGGLSGFLMTTFVCHLVRKGVVLPSMSMYQVLRLTFVHLSKSDWLEDPVSLCSEVGKGGRPTLEQFKDAFDVVFIDVTGFLNLALAMTTALYRRVCHEAELAMKSLAADQFDTLFMVPCPFHLKFDLTYRISFPEDSLSRVVGKLQLTNQVLDQGGLAVSAVVPRLVDLLQQGLGDRVLLLQTMPVASPVWSVREEQPPSVREVIVGVLLHGSNSLRVLDRGPAANAPEAHEFLQFWGEKSELRHFKDGSISEAVLWTSIPSLREKRHVTSLIVTHVLKRHAAIDPDQIDCRGRQLDKFLHVPRRIATQTEKKKGEGSEKKEGGGEKLGRSGASYGTGEERIYQIRRALEELGRALRRLDLPLRINAVTGTDPVFRFTEVFPAHPAVVKGDSLPLYVPAMTVVCFLEGSGHWPEDLEMIRDLKTLYLIDLSEKLRQLGHKVAVSSAHLDVMQSGFVFRLKLGVKREVAVLRMVRSPEGMLKVEDTPQALAVDAEINMLPEMTTLMQGVQQDHPSFCVTVRVVKRWMSAHMLLGHLPELMVERMVMYLYNHPHPFTAPGSPYVGMLRFLKLVSSAECKVEQWCDKVMTPPPPVIVNWLRKVAPHSLQALLTTPESEWKVIFRPPLDVFDLVIHLSPRCMTRRHQSLEVKDMTLATFPSRLPRCKEVTQTGMPVVDFNPVEMFLGDLEDIYGDFALFFHDRYGGDIIAVLFKPHAKQPQKFEAATLYAHKPTIIDNEPALTFDIDAMMETIHRLGGDMIVKVV
ncbi:hypothetical protein ACOMHN_033566 [Nucella lapillus]